MSAPAFVFKGSEPLLQDFPRLIAWMLQAPIRKASRVIGDHFPLSEGKIPGALSLKEAMREADIALDVQRKHLRNYGALARAPVPLFVHAFSEAQTSECGGLLRSRLSRPAFDRVEPVLEKGLAIYVYFYPCAPVRANYWGGIGSPQLAEYLKKFFDKQSAVQGWVRLMVRLLYLGYLPYSVRNDGLGACMDAGNATLDGGFCDLDSIIPIDASPDDEFFREAFVQSLSVLQDTIGLILGLSVPVDLYPNIDSFVLSQFVRRLIADAVLAEKQPGLHLDDRLTKLMSPCSVADVACCTHRKKRLAGYQQFAKQSLDASA